MAAVTMDFVLSRNFCGGSQKVYVVQVRVSTEEPSTTFALINGSFDINRANEGLAQCATVGTLCWNNGVVVHDVFFPFQLVVSVEQNFFPQFRQTR